MPSTATSDFGKGIDALLCCSGTVPPIADGIAVDTLRCASDSSSATPYCGSGTQYKTLSYAEYNPHRLQNLKPHLLVM